jgi:lipopolysaccharide transport system permease protein
MHHATDGQENAPRMKATLGSRPMGAIPDVTRIRPSSGWAALRLGELWQYRELLYFFVWRDLKVRYKQTALGAAWAILQPVALTAVFTVFLGGLAGIAPAGLPYALFVLSGLVPWALFSQSLTRAADSLVASANLLQKVYFPRLLLPVASLGAPIVDAMFGLAALLAAMVILDFAPTLRALWVLPFGLIGACAALTAGIWLSAINVRYRDVRHAVPFIVQLWFFATPIIYSATVVPEQIRWAYYLNPMAGVIDGFRWALLGQPPPPVIPFVASIIITAALLTAGLFYFRRVERAFADVI